MAKERRITAPYHLSEIPTEPPFPAGLNIEDLVQQTLALLVAVKGQEMRLLKVDHRDRLLTCPSGDEANRATQTRGLAAALPATIVFQADTIAWAIVLTAGGIEVDMQDALGVSYGAFTIQNAGVWEMHIPCAQVVLTASVWTAAAASHWAIIEWRRA